MYVYGLLSNLLQSPPRTTASKQRGAAYKKYNKLGTFEITK